MNLLLVNDDGIQSPGLWALSGALVRSHAVTVAAPDGNRSAIGHGITLREPLYAARADFPHGVEAWACRDGAHNGQPPESASCRGCPYGTVVFEFGQ